MYREHVSFFSPAIMHNSFQYCTNIPNAFPNNIKNNMASHIARVQHQEGLGFGIELCFTLHPCIVLLVPNVFLCAL